MFEFLIDVQRSIYAALSADIATFSDTRDWMTLLAMLPLGIVFGAAHALTPGHSKSVLAAYVLGSGLKPARALFVSLALSLTHVSSAVLLACVVHQLKSSSLGIAIFCIRCARIESRHQTSDSCAARQLPSPCSNDEG